MTRDEILTAIEEARRLAIEQRKTIPEAEFDKGVTAAEYARAHEISHTAACTHLTEMVEAGVLVVDWSCRLNVVGRKIKKPVYRSA